MFKIKPSNFVLCWWCLHPLP